MRTLLRVLVTVLMVALGAVAGYYLITGFVLWKLALFILTCWVIGQLAKILLVAINRKYPR